MKDLRVPEKRYRPEIEGVRTVATLLVAIYHIWLGKVSGGIDVFFVLSGFLITTSILSRIERTGSIGYGNFVVGLAKRLFPQALFVTLITGLAAIFIIPKVQWESLVQHIKASTLYFENWRLAFDAVDYLARDNATSPLQHFWSLSVQGQFYIVWPFVIGLAFLLARFIFKTPIRKTLLAVLVTLFVASLAYSIYKTNTNQPWAYFDTFARVWEFSIGGMFALLLPYLRMNKYVSTVAGWIGIFVILFTGILLPVSTVFPGFLALVPISGALLVLLASENSTKLGIDKFLSVKPLVFIGGLTYGIYLWHWPLLIFYQTRFETQDVPLLHGALILLLTFVLAYFSTNLVEKPIRTLNVKVNKVKLYGALSTLLILVAAMGMGFQQYVQAEKEKMENQVITFSDYPGASAMVEGSNPPTEGIELIPSVTTISKSLPELYSDFSCQGRGKEEVIHCEYGVTEGYDYTIAVVGGSHSAHWLPTLQVLAEEMNFKIDSYNHDACRLTTDDPDLKYNEICLKWNANIIEHLKENTPDLVFTLGSYYNHDKIPVGFINQWKALDGHAYIFGIRDTPRMLEVTAACLDTTNNPDDCSSPRSKVLSDSIPWENHDDIPDNVYFADLSDYFCDEETCHSVIGNIIVFRDLHHMTKEYSESLAPMLKAPLQEAFDLVRSGEFEKFVTENQR